MKHSSKNIERSVQGYAKRTEHNCIIVETIPRKICIHCFFLYIEFNYRIEYYFSILLVQ